ncbi:HAMP domain-containing histidine kinase [bacterium]|nr:HAMP domain-containing histidine kinase [bacterium]
MRSLSIRSRLIFLFIVQIVIIFIAGGFYLDWRLRETLEKELGRKLEILAQTIALQIDGELLQSIGAGDEETRTYRSLKSQIDSIQSKTSLRRIYAFDADRASILDTKPDTPIGTPYAFLQFNQRETARLFEGQSASSPLFTGSDGRLYKTGFAPIKAKEGVVAGLGLEGSAETLEAIVDVRGDLLILGIAVLIGSIVMGFLFSKRITSPINQLENAAKKIAAGNYESPIKVARTDEIGFLGQTMEEMRRAIIQRDMRQKAMLAGVAHEIRNPLGGIELFAGLLADEIDDENQKNEARKILKEVRNLNQIVQDFLNYARPVEPKKELCRIKEVFAEARMLVSAQLNGYEVEYEEAYENEQVYADAQHLKQIFLNLLKNSGDAMASSGTIQLQVRRKHDLIELRFTDSGPGVPPEIREQIFEPFFTRKKNGTGLGLAIVKSLVEENGGEIKMMEGEGAVFYITLPSSLSRS